MKVQLISDMAVHRCPASKIQELVKILDALAFSVHKPLRAS